MTTICQIFNTFKKFSQEMVADAAKPLNKKTNIKSSSEKEEPIVLINEDIFETDSESEEEKDIESVEEEEENVEVLEEYEDVEVLEEEEDVEAVEEEEDVEVLEEYEDVEVLEEYEDVEAMEEDVEVLEEQPIPESPPRRRVEMETEKEKEPLRIWIFDNMIDWK
jgi:hypothetical protein